MINELRTTMTTSISPIRENFLVFMPPKASEYKMIIEGASNGRRLPGNIWGYLMCSNQDLENVWKQILIELPQLMDPMYDNTPVWGKAGYLLKKKVFENQALVDSVIKQVINDSTGRFSDSKIVDAFLNNIQSLNNNSMKKIKIAVIHTLKSTPKKLAIVFSLRLFIHLIVRMFH